VLVGIGALLAASGVAADAGGNDKEKPLERTETAIAFRNDMRKLWEDHITWTRLFIVSFAAEAPDTSATAGRLLQNQADIGDAIKPYYGGAAGDQLTALLQDHILGAADLLQAAKSGDTEAFNAANSAWYANGVQIAEFLHGANPENWPQQETTHHMHMHLDLTLKEAAARLGGDFVADIAAYDEVHLAILEMSDFLALGIINQFPKEFR
jgi:hypothetical protein